MVILDDLKHEAVKVLKSGKVKYIIGYLLYRYSQFISAG